MEGDIGQGNDEVESKAQVIADIDKSVDDGNKRITNFNRENSTFVQTAESVRETAEAQRRSKGLFARIAEKATPGVELGEKAKRILGDFIEEGRRLGKVMEGFDNVTTRLPISHSLNYDRTRTMLAGMILTREKYGVPEDIPVTVTWNYGKGEGLEPQQITILPERRDDRIPVYTINVSGTDNLKVDSAYGLPIEEWDELHPRKLEKYKGEQLRDWELDSELSSWSNIQYRLKDGTRVNGSELDFSGSTKERK
jgi:hypothetical protein